MNTATKPSFNLVKGSAFQLEKGMALAHCGLGWDEPPKGQPTIDLDVHCFGLVYVGGDSNIPRLHGDGTHALCYAFVQGPSNPNGTLKKNPADRSFETMDGSMWHCPDNRTGREGSISEEHDDEEHEGMREEIKLTLEKLPSEIDELAVWATIHDADKKKQHFGLVKNAFVEVCDPNDQELCRYKLTSEFNGQTMIQVASFIKQEDGSWKFHAIGAGSNKSLLDVINAYLS
jgi:tellurium resistance protein TerD